MTFSLGSTPRSLVKYNNQSISAITDIVASAKDDMVLIKELTASSSATLDFVDGTDDVVLDSTYPIYKFVFINIHPSTAAVLSFQGNAAGGSGYNETITSTMFQTYHTEDDGETGFGYDTGSDQAQGTSFQGLTSGSTATNNDDNLAGFLYLFNPSSTTFVKHFIARWQNLNSTSDPNSNEGYAAGYFNTTSAIDEIQFKMSGGNIDAGTIKLYGIKDS